MSEIIVTELYVSCIDQKINGRVYMAGEMVPEAGSLPTLAALLDTNRLRVASTAMPPSGGMEESAADLGVEEAQPRAEEAPRKKRKYTRRKKTKKRSKEATVG